MQGAADSGLTAEAALEWTSQQRPRVQAIAPHWIDEIQGLAQGAGIRSDEALALQLRPGTGGLPEGCTSFAAVGDATTNRQTIAGQNRDLGEPYLHRMFIAVLRPTQGPAILMHCVPGEIGGVGLNSHGVALFANSLWGRSGRTWMAPPILRRAALEAATAQAAVQRIQACLARPSATFSSPTPTTPATSKSWSKASTSLKSTTASTPTPTTAPPAPCSRTKPSAARFPIPKAAAIRCRVALDRHAGSIDTDVCRTLLSDETGRPEPVCRRPRSGDPFSTIAALIAEPHTRTLHLSYGPPTHNHFTTYRL